MSSFTDSLSGGWAILWSSFVWLGLLGGWVFVVLYWVATKGRWIHGRFGRHLMAMSIAVAQALTAYMLRIAFGDFPGRSFLMFEALVFLVFVVWWRTFMFLREHKRERAKSREPA